MSKFSMGFISFVVVAAYSMQGCAKVPMVVSKDTPVCNGAQLLAYAPRPEEVEANRKFALPVISYAYGTKREDWGLQLTLRLDESGRVECYLAKDVFGTEQALNAERRAALKEIGGARYKPFLHEGKAVAAIFSEQVVEQELPGKHVPLAQVPPEQVHITLERTGCYGWCPSYCVEVYGDGRAIYHGGRYVDVEGKHDYRVPKEDVARLVESLRTKDLWSMRSEYQAGITDNPTYVLTLQVGGQSRKIIDYVGEMVGMPSVVSEFEDEVDKVAQSDRWKHLTTETVEQLKAGGFKFDSQAGAELLARTVANDDSRDEAAMLALIELGAPLVVTTREAPGFLGTPGPLVESALHNHRVMLLQPLVDRGALDTNGKRDQKKIDDAFRAAIQGGRLEEVKAVWNIPGPNSHPSLTFEDRTDDDKPVLKQSPLTLALSPPYGDDGWEGMEIAQWLVGQGCDLKARAADGGTLLHIATNAGDARFVRYLLDQGLDASTPGEFDLPALGSARNEDIALMLLQAGTDFSLMDDDGHQFQRYAKDNHWGRVVAWLKEHKQG
ncbi:MAG: ankyrin repeat domain-containing protein [Pseudoxanthomonas sp.]